MGVIIFFVILYVIYKAFSSGEESGSAHGQKTVGGSATVYNNWGHFTDGFYIEETDVYVKGPVFSYKEPRVDMPNFLTFGEGNLHFRNSTGNLEVFLRKISDNRIVPVHFSINGKTMFVIDKYGNTHNGNDYTTISVARTLSLMLNTLEDHGANENLIIQSYAFIKELLVFNMLIKRRIITSYSNQHILIPNENVNSFSQKYEQLYQLAGKNIESYADNYSKQQQEDYITELLKILELPSNTRDMSVIKNQYKQLAKKYHPDRNKNTEEKMKKINVAYEELCEYLKAS